MALYVKQSDTRSQLQEKLAAELQEKARAKAKEAELPDGVDDSAVSRLVAQHVHHCAVHPAFRAMLHRRPQRAGRDDQLDDARRPRARRRHPRGRRDGGD